MALNQFTTQSAWISCSNAKDTSLQISASDTWYAISLSNVAVLNEKSIYNFNTPIALKDWNIYPKIKGVYLITASMTTSGAVNHSLSFRAGFGSVANGFTYPPNMLTYDSKGGNEWAVNYNTIMEIKNLEDGVDYFVFEGRNNTSTNDIEYVYLNISILKLY